MTYDERIEKIARCLEAINGTNVGPFTNVFTKRFAEQYGLLPQSAMALYAMREVIGVNDDEALTEAYQEATAGMQ